MEMLDDNIAIKDAGYYVKSFPARFPNVIYSFLMASRKKTYVSVDICSTPHKLLTL